MEKLDYTYWRSQFETVLELYELTQIVKEKALLPTVEDNFEFEEWRRANRLVMTWIKFTVATSVQQMIVSCKTAKEAWDRLEKFLSPLCHPREKPPEQTSHSKEDAGDHHDGLPRDDSHNG